MPSAAVFSSDLVKKSTHYIQQEDWQRARWIIRAEPANCQSKTLRQRKVSPNAKEKHSCAWPLLAGINSRCGMRGALRKHLEGAFSTWRNTLLTKTRRDGYPERRWSELAVKFVRYVARVCEKHLSFHSGVLIYTIKTSNQRYTISI